MKLLYYSEFCCFVKHLKTTKHSFICLIRLILSLFKPYFGKSKCAQVLPGKIEYWPFLPQNAQIPELWGHGETLWTTSKVLKKNHRILGPTRNFLSCREYNFQKDVLILSHPSDIPMQFQPVFCLPPRHFEYQNIKWKSVSQKFFHVICNRKG